MTDSEFLTLFLKESENHTPWLYEGSIWKTEASYWAWVRGQFRAIWKDWPMKNNYLNKASIQIPVLDENGDQVIIKSGKKKGQGKTVKGYKCEVTGKLVKASKPKGQRWANYNVDHIEPAGACTNAKEAAIYFLRLLTSQDNMQILDTEYHKILTHMEKKGFKTIEEARADKTTIEICKGNEKQWLSDRGIDPASNAKLRREQVYNYLIDDSKGEKDARKM